MFLVIIRSIQVEIKVDLGCDNNSLVSKLEERLRCPVCLEVPTTGPVYNCLYGHSVCSSCYTGYNSDCPQCRVKMYNITSLLAATVIDNIDHTCQHEGCGERFPADLLCIHHDQCNFRLVKCPALKCGDRMPFNSILDHLSNDCSHCSTLWHLPVKIMLVTNVFASLKYTFKEQSAFAFFTQTFFLEDHYLFSIIYPKKNTLRFYTQMLGSDAELKKF